MVDAFAGEEGTLELLANEDVAELVDEARQVVAVDDLPARAVRKLEVGGQFGVGQDDDVVPAQASLGPAGILLDVVAQRVAGFAGLADGVDPMLVAAALLAPAFAVVPDFAALDLEADNARAFDGDDEVGLVVLEVIGDALAGDDEVVGLELIDQHLPGAPLRRVGEAGRFGDGDAQRLGGSTLSSHSRISNPPRCSRLLRAMSTMLSMVAPCSAAIAVRTSRMSAASSMTSASSAARSSVTSSRSLAHRAVR